MFNREKIIKNFFIRNKRNSRSNYLRSSLKNKCFMVAFIQKLEYGQSLAGRCISYRSKRNGMDSIVMRNKKFAAEVRLILNNPRLVVLI